MRLKPGHQKASGDNELSPWPADARVWPMRCVDGSITTIRTPGTYAPNWRQLVEIDPKVRKGAKGSVAGAKAEYPLSVQLSDLR
jgi:hypothetical protein